MATIIVLFNLKPGVEPAAYEQWARDRDVPTVNGLASVQEFRVQKAVGLLGADGPAPYQYIEILEHDGLDALMPDIGGAEMQAVAAEFAEYADNPTFVITERSA